ncbi:MAG: aminoacetone oxidase family FAD-binding enzyme [Flavobacteriales bacterium]|nr:aminoacetone oxidase family FAD-binding enzyme [Flavobacteriales bacterium]
MRIAVIGGGPAGFMAAITAKKTQENTEVTIFEKTNSLLRKVKVSGGGRCNVTNATFSISKLIKNYPRGGKQLRKSFNEFHTTDTVNWFKEKGIALVAEDDKRIFPQSNSSQTIVNCLLNTAKSLKIIISLKSTVNKIISTKDGFNIKINNQSLFFEKVIIATGGNSKKETYNWLEEIGHTINKPVPSLFTFNLKNKSICDLMGLSAPNVITTIKGSKLKNEGPLLITHWGFSGPAILKLSSWAARDLADLKYEFVVAINWLAINENQLRNDLEKILKSKKIIYNYNPFKIPKRLWAFILQNINIKDCKKWNELSKKEKNRLINKLTNDEYRVSGKTTYKEEFVTCGGIRLEEIQMKTMESKIHKGLYFTGEILDIDGITGGFNFQAAWTSGYLAGKNSVI